MADRTYQTADTTGISEHTPLLAVVRVAQSPPRRRRYHSSTLRRTCTTILTSLLIICLIAAVLILWNVPPCRRGQKNDWKRHNLCIPHHPFFRDENGRFVLGMGPRITGDVGGKAGGLSYEELQTLLIETMDEEKVREWSQYYTAGPHLAGKNLSQAIWTKEKWEEFGVKSEIVSYDVYVNYPLGHRLALLEKAAKKKDDERREGLESETWKVKYEAVLSEDILEEDPTSGLSDRIPTFHGYSASGNVTGQYVFVNYGTYYDYEDLVTANVSLKGKIALVKYGKIFRGLKVKRAQELGMVGVVIYSDPGDDGGITAEAGFKEYPEGPARNPSSVQRGSVEYLSHLPGDPTTPGYPSKPGVPRVNPNETIPSIPSLPISYLDALPLLKALNGHGPKASSFNEYWQGGGLGYKNVSYNIGPSPAHLQLNLVNEQEYVTTPMWNVIGIINGTLADEVVILGNHRDAWIAGGAVDPNSGSAALNEVIRAYGKALAQGWKPLRTLVFASWDGEEYGLIGSTEWVEEFIPWLNASGVAYLNVDSGAAGPEFRCRAAPILNQAVIDIAGLVQSPNQTVVNQTVADVWEAVSDKNIMVMGSGSDFTAFQDYAGISSADMAFEPDSKSAVYHYHSNYDSFAWMDKFGDSGWHYHVTISRLWALLAAKLVESPVLPFNATDYATALHSYLLQVRKKGEAFNNSTSTADSPYKGKINATFPALTRALQVLQNASVTHDAEALALATEIKDNPLPWWKWWEKIKLAHRLKEVNDKYKNFDRALLHADGLDGRSWFKHVVYAPGIWTGYSAATFPGLVEALENGNVSAVYRWEAVISGLVFGAANTLTKK